MKRILLLILMLILLIMPSTFASNGNVYENQEYKFRITFPDGWQIKDQKEPIVEARAPKGFTSLAIFVESMSGRKIISDNITQEIEDTTVTPFVKDMQKDFPTMVLIDKRHLNISNCDALRITFKDDYTYCITYFFFNKDYFFTVPTAGAARHLDTDQEIFNQILSTFKFLD